MVLVCLIGNFTEAGFFDCHLSQFYCMFFSDTDHVDQNLINLFLRISGDLFGCNLSQTRHVSDFLYGTKIIIHVVHMLFPLGKSNYCNGFPFLFVKERFELIDEYLLVGIPDFSADDSEFTIEFSGQ